MSLHNNKTMTEMTEQTYVDILAMDCAGMFDAEAEAGEDEAGSGDNLPSPRRDKDQEVVYDFLINEVDFGDGGVDGDELFLDAGRQTGLATPRDATPRDLFGVVVGGGGGSSGSSGEDEQSDDIYDTDTDTDCSGSGSGSDDDDEDEGEEGGGAYRPCPPAVAPHLLLRRATELMVAQTRRIYMYRARVKEERRQVAVKKYLVKRRRRKAAPAPAVRYVRRQALSKKRLRIGGRFVKGWKADATSDTTDTTAMDTSRVDADDDGFDVPAPVVPAPVVPAPVVPAPVMPAPVVAQVVAARPFVFAVPHAVIKV